MGKKAVTFSKRKRKACLIEQCRNMTKKSLAKRKAEQLLEAAEESQAEMPQAEMPQAEVPMAVKPEVPKPSEAITVMWKSDSTQEPSTSLDTTTHSLLIEIEPMKRAEQPTKELRSQLKYCAVPTCLKNQITHPDLTFFSLPFDTILRKYWCRRIDRDDLWLLPLTQVSKHYVCNLHFEDRYKFYFNSKLGLLSKALPSLELPVRERKPRKKKDSGVDCSVLYCENNSKANPRIKYFLVPRQKDKLFTWNHNMGVKQYCRMIRMICEEHFEKRFIKVTRGGKFFLTESAVPTLKLPISDDQIMHRIVPNPRARVHLVRPKTPSKTNKKRNTVSTQTYETTFSSVSTLEFVDLSTQFQEVNESLATTQKITSVEECKREEDVRVKEENEDEYTVVISTNPLDPAVVDALHDSVAEVRVKNEPQEFENSGMELGLASEQKDFINTTSEVTLSVNTMAKTSDPITTSASFAKRKIQELYQNGNDDMRLLFYYCDRYCSERTNGLLQLEKEILH